MRNMDLAELAEIAAVRIHHRCGVVIDAGAGLLIDWHHERHAEPARFFAHGPDGGAVRHPLGGAVPLAVLFGGDVGQVEDFLEPQQLDSLPRRLLHERAMRGNHLLADPLGRLGCGIALEAHLDEPAFHLRHGPSPFLPQPSA